MEFLLVPRNVVQQAGHFHMIEALATLVLHPSPSVPWLQHPETHHSATRANRDGAHRLSSHHEPLVLRRCPPAVAITLASPLAMSSKPAPSIPSHSPFKAAAEVSFTPLSDAIAESSSQASARSSAGKRSSVTSERVEKRMVASEVNGRKERTRKSGGFLLDAVFTHPHPATEGRLSDGQLHVDKRKLNSSHTSEHSSPRASPLSRQVSVHGANEERVHDSRPSAMDPAQLVQMALNLSESRKRHVSNILQPPVSPAASRRIASGLDSAYGTVRGTPPRSRHVSRLIDGSPQHTPESLRSSQDGGGGVNAELVTNDDNVIYTFSPATLTRAEKVRRYFELASEHRRLLEYLPPLKPDSSAPEAPSVANATAQNNLVRVPTYYELGRPYNPLQALRDRRLRNQEKSPLATATEKFQNTDRINTWIDQVAEVSRDPDFRFGEDQIRLPELSGEQTGESSLPSETAPDHRKTDTVGSVVARPENGWTIEPAELLADTYWIEEADNKALIEDRHGRRLFPRRRCPSADHVPRSVESSRDNDAIADRRSMQDESESNDKHKQRHRHVLHLPERLRRHKELRGPRSRAGSTSTDSSVDARNPPALLFNSAEGGDENIGPLERHMREMIAKDEAGELPSPELVSPDHWESTHTQFPVDRQSMHRSGRNATHHANGHLSANSHKHKRSRSTDSRNERHGPGSSSMDELVSDSPGSPVVPRRLPTMGMDLSPPKQDQLSPSDQKPKGRRLPLFRTRSKDQHNIEQTDFAGHFGSALSPVQSVEHAELQPSRSSLDVKQPTAISRQLTAESNTNSLRRLNTGNTTTDISTGSSGGRRFFKGGRIGELMRNESFRLGDRFRNNRDRPGETSDASRAASDASDPEDDWPKKHPRSVTDNQEYDSDVSPRASLDRGRLNPKSKYYTSNLPSFISGAGRERRTAAAQAVSDPISRQQKEHREGTRSPRFDRLAPPKINLPDGDSLSVTDAASLRSRNYLDPYDDAPRTKSVSRQSSISFEPPRSTTSSNQMARRHARSGISGLDGQRHWSISDQSRPEKSNKVTSRDIARVRALLLASGIKAHEILEKWNAIPEAPSQQIAQAAQIAEQETQHVRRKEEHLVAADILSQDLSSTLTSFERSLAGFQDSTARRLGSQLDDLQRRAADQLTKLVEETSDEADTFNVELTTKQPQEIKRVDDAVEAMFRQRRRQFRLLRRTGFKLLEWLVLCILWWVWFIFVLINTSRKIVVGTLALLKWLLWF